MAFTRITTLPDADTVNDSDIKYDDVAKEVSDTTNYDLDTALDDSHNALEYLELVREEHRF